MLLYLWLCRPLLFPTSNEKPIALIIMRWWEESCWLWFEDKRTKFLTLIIYIYGYITYLIGLYRTNRSMDDNLASAVDKTLTTFSIRRRRNDRIPIGIWMADKRVRSHNVMVSQLLRESVGCQQCTHLPDFSSTSIRWPVVYHRMHAYNSVSWLFPSSTNIGAIVKLHLWLVHVD